MSTDIQKINSEVTRELANKETLQTLVFTTFKGLEEANIKQAIVEGMMRGFTFQDFLQKNIYAIPFQNKTTGKQEYSLVTSIDYARKIGMRSGVVGNSEPTFEEKDGRIVTCTSTVKCKVGNDIGDFTAKVYFQEYTTNKNLWTSKPRTMIAKVAEMHALRKACPEEMSQVYVEEELEQKVEGKGMLPAQKLDPIDLEAYSKKMQACKTIEELKTVFSAMPFEAKQKLNSVKEGLQVYKDWIATKTK